ncbi:hypothetical protein [Flavobacterium algoritolerans]|uniref:50S ribosomal protein L29 n=1 Tax=Flavobacterium algoritolerans TaxID=3041254 RepID=A0ABT6VD49_9FLAO|nr:hypothetical protein [Flavobacterium algoritolerans]MDI5895826.1 hypothetical protein [Flavobacterium algoritolerans]
MKKILLEFTNEEYLYNILTAQNALKKLILKEKLLKSSSFLKSIRIVINRVKIIAIREHISTLRKYQKINQKLTA